MQFAAWDHRACQWLNGCTRLLRVLQLSSNFAISGNWVLHNNHLKTSWDKLAIILLKGYIHLHWARLAPSCKLKSSIWGDASWNDVLTITISSVLWTSEMREPFILKDIQRLAVMHYSSCCFYSGSLNLFFSTLRPTS